VAFLDARKAIGLFQTVKVPIAGIIENMSSFHCPSCHAETPIFGHGGVKAAAKRMGLPFLGEIPIDLDLRVGSDEGVPLVVGHPQSPQAAVFLKMARTLRTAVITPAQ
jgi:ATP-binding protein involved in chromosome partitioning